MELQEGDRVIQKYGAVRRVGTVDYIENNRKHGLTAWVTFDLQAENVIVGNRQYVKNTWCGVSLPCAPDSLEKLNSR